jgi:2-phosphosulfolactate phosphatase
MKMKKLEVCLSPNLIDLYELKGKNIVVADIFRATTSMISALVGGVVSITPKNNLEECRDMFNLGYTIAGERDGAKAKGFELGNSPLSYLDGKYKGKKIAMTTTNGTFAIEKSKTEAENVLVGAFINLEATVTFLKKFPNDALIVCAGWKGKFNLEDSLYAGALASRLSENFFIECDAAIAVKNLFETNSADLNKILSLASHTKRLQNQNIEADIEFCLKPDLFNIIGILRGKEIVAEYVD